MVTEKFLRSVTDALANAWAVFPDTVQGRFVITTAPSVHSDQNAALAGLSRQSKSHLLVYVILSLVLGKVLGVLLGWVVPPDRRDMSPVLWIAFLFLHTVATYLLCRMLLGKGTFGETLFMIVRVYATLLILTPPATCVVYACARASLRFHLIRDPSVADLLTSQQLCYVAGYVLLLLIYVPLAMRRVHGFGIIRSLLVGWVPLVIAPLGLLSVLAFLLKGIRM